MSVNSFENYLLTWKPDKSLLTFPMYRSLSELLEQDILSGRLPPGTKLPPQRELADFLDVNLSTVTRAFKLCETKGLIYAVVGSGTYVSPNAALPAPYTQEAEDYIDLGPIKPYCQFNSVVADTARAVLRRPDSEKLFEFFFTMGTGRHRQIARQWLSGFQIRTAAEDIILTSGTQNALVMVLLALFHAGDKIATDRYTYPNFTALAKQLRIQLIPIDADEEGMLPDELEKQGKLQGIKGIYLMPSCTNPTGITMTPERRNALSKAIERQHMLLIEDDTYGFLLGGEVSPMAALIPEHTVYLHGLSKSLSAGLRIAYLVFPHRFQKAFLDTADHINLKIPLLNAEIASELIVGGAAQEIINRKRMLSKERGRLYAGYFPRRQQVNPYSFFQWLPLPPGLDGCRFEGQAMDHGVRVLCSDRFAVGTANQFSAVRLAICSPKTAEELEDGLQIIEKLIEGECTTIPKDELII